MAAVREEPVIPEYDYAATAKEIEMIDNKIQKIKHAIDMANVTQLVRVQDAEYSVDTILARK